MNVSSFLFFFWLLSSIFFKKKSTFFGFLFFLNINLSDSPVNRSNGFVSFEKFLPHTYFLGAIRTISTLWSTYRTKFFKKKSYYYFKFHFSRLCGNKLNFQKQFYIFRLKEVNKLVNIMSCILYIYRQCVRVCIIIIP